MWKTEEETWDMISEGGHRMSKWRKWSFRKAGREIQEREGRVLGLEGGSWPSQVLGSGEWGFLFSMPCVSQEPLKLPGALSIGTTAGIKPGGTWHKPLQRVLHHGIWGRGEQLEPKMPSPKFPLPGGQLGHSRGTLSQRREQS